MIEAVIARLQAAAMPPLAAVDGGETLDAVGAGVAPRGGSAFVLPFRERAEPNAWLSGAFVQRVEVMFLVAICVRHADDASGRRRVASLEALTHAVEQPSQAGSRRTATNASSSVLPPNRARRACCGSSSPGGPSARSNGVEMTEQPKPTLPQWDLSTARGTISDEIPLYHPPGWRQSDDPKADAVAAAARDREMAGLSEAEAQARLAEPETSPAAPAPALQAEGSQVPGTTEPPVIPPDGEGANGRRRRASE